LELSRIGIGSFELDVKLGEWRFLSEEEEKRLLKNFG
jgi:23S rRNA pseudouridine2605 synthase